LEKIQSTGASFGFGFGTLTIYSSEINFETNTVTDYISALNEVVSDLESKITTLNQSGRELEAEVLEAYILISKDSDINNSLDRNSSIKEVFNIFEENALAIESLEDDYFRQRAEDIRSVCKKIILTMQDVDDGVEIKNGTILAAEDLTPADTASMKLQNIEGFVIRYGGPTSHSVIVAKNLGIPCVIGLGENYTKLQNGQEILIDGDLGEVVVDPDSKTMKIFENKKEKYKTIFSSFSREKLMEVDFELRTNIGSEEEIKLYQSEALDSVGLFRSEFIFLDKEETPSLEEQIKINNELASKFSGTVTYRLLDIGGDKLVTYLDLPQEENPFLGNRGLRLLSSNKKLFTKQIESIILSDLYPDVKIMFPMISTVEDFIEGKELVEEVVKKHKKNIPHLGVMIETPSSALIARNLAEYVDFFSIGTNDLTQYTLAADRTNLNMQRYQDPLHPAVIKLIKEVVIAGSEHNIEVSVCGEMASDPIASIVLYALGVRILSLSPNSAPIIFHNLINSKFLINNESISFDKFTSAKEIRKYIEKIN
jgi:phosphotransferase system enzyme I (PtsI)|tara:strand:- start:71 stop:1690 length:1620 start_codon:yes stop_codon:yes gene_type:complete